SGPEWMFDIDTLTNSMNYQPVSAGNRTNGNAGLETYSKAGQAGKENVPDQEYILLPLMHTSSNVPWKRISEKRTKNQAKTDKTKHGMEKHGKAKVKSKPMSKKVKVKSQPRKSTIKSEAENEEYLMGPPEPI
ncbi:hypothetical protein Tco_0783638, partial [Tanacetum coccineum]